MREWKGGGKSLNISVLFGVDQRVVKIHYGTKTKGYIQLYVYKYVNRHYQIVLLTMVICEQCFVAEESLKAFFTKAQNCLCCIEKKKLMSEWIING